MTSWASRALSPSQLVRQAQPGRSYELTGTVVAGPEIGSRGFVYVKESEELMDEVKQAVREALAARQEPEVIDRELIGAVVRSAVRRFISQRFDRKPVVIPLVLEI